MSGMTTVQKITYSVRILNGLGEPAPIDPNSPPVAASSDETVVAVTQPVDGGNGAWNFDAIAIGVLPGNARVTFTADADVGDGVNSIVGDDSIDVAADPRLDERRVELTAGAPQDV